MISLEDLKIITDKDSGLGIPLNVLARYSQCHPTLLSKYLRNEIPPSKKTLQKIHNGLTEFHFQLSSILSEE